MPSLYGFLDGHAERIYALMRIGVPFLYLCHGAQKFFGVLGGHPVWGGSPLFIAAGIIEITCGPLMLLGLMTRAAAFVAAGEMAVAYFWMHLPRDPWPILNHGELPVAFCFVFLYIAARGPGIWSLDRLLARRRPASSS